MRVPDRGSTAASAGDISPRTRRSLKLNCMVIRMKDVASLAEELLSSRLFSDL